VRGLEQQQVDLYLPKFSLRSRFENLRAPLEHLGVKDAFDDKRADFSGMDGTRDLFLGAVVHESFVQVDEEGTIAAAATGGVMRGHVVADAPAGVQSRPAVRVPRP